MSTGNEPAQLNPVDNQPPLTPEATAQAAAPAAAVVDIDDAALNEAKAAAQAEEAAAKSPQPGEGTAPPAPQQAAPKDPAQQQAPLATIPKPRFDEVRARADKLAQENAYLQGQLDARTAPPAPAPAAAAPAQAATPEQRLAAIAAARETVAKKFDDGEYSAAEWRREDKGLADQEHAIREDVMLSKVKPAAPAQDGNELYLETLTAQLETQHPWTLVFDQVGTQSDWAYLKQRAHESLASQGIDTTIKSPMATFQLRKEVARLADELGPGLVGARAQAKGFQLPGTQAQQPQQQQKPALSAAAQARQTALTKAAGAPPDITAMTGHNGEPGGMPTEAAIEAMTEAQFDAMPLAIRRKAMGLA